MGVESMVAYRLAREWDTRSRKRRPPRPPFNTAGYPNDFEHYIGQAEVKEQLRVSTMSARVRGVPLRHVLITSGVAGCGKTAFAVAIAGELGVKMQVLSGTITADDAMDAMADLDDGDLVVLEEVHRMVDGGKKKAEWLLHLLADGQIIDGRGVHPMPAVTVVATTTDAGRLPETILSRFPIRAQLDPYTEAEARQILACELSKWPPGVPQPSVETLIAIVKAGNRNPRNMKALLGSVLDAAVVKAAGGEEVPFERVLEWAGLTEDGLDKLAQRMIVVLASEFGGTAGERPLVARLREPGGIRYAEQVLQEKDLLTLTPSGRCLTKDGWERARELAMAGVEV